ncbi:MAG: NAD-dependent epimerase/dehydratase family protein [Thermoguttaceae bacterium]
MAKVLITGGSGFIGSHLVSALASRGHKVTCLVRQSSRIEHLQNHDVRLVYADITKPDNLPSVLTGQDYVYHLAGLTMSLRAADFFSVNQYGCHNIAQACALQPNPPVLLMVSSLAAVGPALNNKPKVESDPPRPLSAYGRSKRAAEIAVERFADRVPATIVRPPIVLGEGDRLGLPIFQSIYRFNIHFVPGIGRHRFSVIHAADAAELFIRAAEHGKRLPSTQHPQLYTGEGCYFAACGEDVVYDELGHLIAKAMGRRTIFPLHLSAPVVWLSAGIMQIASKFTQAPLPMTLDKACEALAGSWTCSPCRAKDELGFTVQTSLLERLHQTVQWYRHAGWL